MKLYLREITESDLELSLDSSEKWLNNAVSQADESDDTEISPTILAKLAKSKKARAIQLKLRAHKLDQIYILNGRIQTSVHLICSRCATYFDFPLDHKFSSLYSKDRVMAGISESGDSTRNYARHSHDDDSESQDIDITYLTDDFINMADLVVEQIQLQLPFRPLCSDTCQGVCVTCGTNLNLGRCACKKIGANNPFAQLASKNFSK